MDMIASLHTSMNTRFDALDDKISDIQERVMRLEARDRGEVLNSMNKRSIFGVSRLHNIEAKDLGDQGIMKKKRSSHSKIKALKTLKTYVLVRDMLRKTGF
ncbi:hypothetical protein M9H77_02195 [Catharanthus roseus]|uniref:Uncharacterized protein n=1 Tax=Catharanthus roseus TaxID=4058 RepID=A0ACC0C881_CATRO|nr:hypothetical protein M9H77_02195 [Catharanthus roseus]